MEGGRLDLNVRGTGAQQLPSPRSGACLSFPSASSGHDWHFVIKGFMQGPLGLRQESKPASGRALLLACRVEHRRQRILGEGGCASRPRFHCGSANGPEHRIVRPGCHLSNVR